VRGPVGQTLLEVLGSLMTPALCEVVVADALERAGWTQVPEHAGRLRELAEGPLRETVTELVGVDAAQHMLRDLEPILQVAESGVRRRESPAARPKPLTPKSRISSFPPAASPGEALRLLVLTCASLEDLKKQLGSVDVGRVQDAFELLTAIESRTGPMLVVVDGYRPMVGVETLAAFMPRVPDGVRLVLWGFEPRDTLRVQHLRGWSAIEAGPDFGDLASALPSLR